MKNNDKTYTHQSCDGTMAFVYALTERARPNSEYEVHPHHNELEIYRFTDGDLFFAFEGKRYEVTRGCMIIIADGTLHRPIIKAPCRYERVRLMFSRELFSRMNTSGRELYGILRNRKIMILSAEKTREAGIDECFGEIERSLSRRTEYEDFCAEINLFSLLIKAEKISGRSESEQARGTDGKAAQIVRYIEEHLSEDLCYRELAKIFYISEKSLYKFFKKETGFTPASYINERRIIKAQSVLNAGGSAADAALAAGFKDYSVFYRSFVRKTGVTPAKYLKK